VLILRWFWWRINAWTELAAMVAGFLVGLGTSVIPLIQIEDFGLRLMVTSLITLAVWLPVMLLTPSESLERLDAFYRRVRPGGPGWRLQRARTGLEPPRRLGHDVLRAVAGLGVLFGAMFGVGALLLQRPWLAVGMAGLAAAGMVALRALGREAVT
jgi:hypothetical protein